MSWSKQGRLFIGQRVTSLQEQVQDFSLDSSKENQQEYLSRVRDRAREEAEQILARTRQEAESIRSEAYEQALKEAREKSEQDLAQERQRLHKRFQALLDSIQQDKQKLWVRHQEDILQLLDLALEKCVSVSLQTDKKDILKNLLQESLQLLENQQEVLVRVHPEDQALMQEMLQEAQNKYPALSGWRVEKDQNLDPGSLVLENRESKIDNSVSKRWAAVRQVLEQLALNGKE
ncbi:MAG: FliH/SctL family protein [Thermodesulfobacteriota bacterium]